MTSYNLKAVGAVLFPNLGGLLIGRKITKANLDSWYNKLKLPEWRPPNWVFGPAWTSLYSGMGYASYLVYRDCGGFTDEAKLPLALYGTQLALNWAWIPIFFGRHDIKGGLYDMLALTATASACAASFYKVNPLAGYLLLPYVAWLSYATFLNYTILKMNPKPEELTSKKSAKKKTN